MGLTAVLSQHNNANPHELICECTGEVYPSRTQLQDNRCVMQMGNDFIVDAKHYGTNAKFINSTCGNPNTYASMWLVDDVPHIGIFANKFIPGGTPLTIHYNYTERQFQSENTPCLCGDQVHCTGWLHKFPTCFSCGDSVPVKPLHCNHNIENTSHVTCLQCHCNTCRTCHMVPEIL